jgi:hypothetical protein
MSQGSSSNELSGNWPALQASFPEPVVHDVDIQTWTKKSKYTYKMTFTITATITALQGLNWIPPKK